MSGPRLAIVGIGEDGWEGLGPQARALVRNADLVVGGARHLAFLPEGGPERRAWPSPMLALVDEIAADTARRVAVLASGDPMLHGVGSLFAVRVDRSAMQVVPQVSSFQIACARLGWPVQDTALVSACGRPVEALAAELFEGARIVVFSADSRTPGAVARLLAAHGFAASAMHVMEHLGGARERIATVRAGEWDGDRPVADLNLVALEARGAPGLTRVPGLPEAAFCHDGQITKREIRALALARLGPLPGRLLWDIGAGSGSVGIEWMRAARGARSVAVEADSGRAARARENAARLGVPALRVVEGRAPEALAGLPAPDAVFVGGGLTVPGVFEAAWSALKPGGRLVANAVTLESEARLLALRGQHGGDLARLSAQRAEKVGAMTGWRPAMPVTQWVVDKAGEPA